MPRSPMVRTRVPPQMLAAVEREAARTGLTVSEWARDALMLALEKAGAWPPVARWYEQATEREQALEMAVFDLVADDVSGCVKAETAIMLSEYTRATPEREESRVRAAVVLSAHSPSKARKVLEAVATAPHAWESTRECARSLLKRASAPQ